MSKHNFHRNFAIIIGINNYQNSIRELITAVPDALKLAEIIQKQHKNLKPQYQAQNKYEVQLLLNQRASLSQLKQLIADFKQGQITLDKEKVTVTESDRLLFYFAGHGIALDALENQEGPVGYLIPQDAISGDSSTYLPMQELHDALNALPCRHMLAILDCCFAGAFRWASVKREIVRKVQIYKERYDRFISDRAWQVITSASDDQKALDSLGSRGRASDGNEIHSPFAKALFDVLLGKGGDSNQDGMVTATELYSYLRDQVEIASENYYQRQTPSLCPLRKHDKGEFIFLLPDFDRDKLEDAPPLNIENNPYRGLSSYDEKDSNLFFGREEQIQKLYQKVFDNKQQLTLVLGASGTGKSSLVKAGLIPKLRKDDKTWRILPPFRPGESPLKSLNNVLESVKQPLIQAGTSSRLFTPAEESLGNWFKNNPQAKLLVVIDQFEELITLSKSEEAEKFQIFTKNILAKYPNNIHVVITLRLDFEAQFQTSVLKDFWNDEARFVVSPMSQNEFRQAIEKPALEKVLYFDPPSLVDELINEVVQMPGALPLLSFTLSELYLKYLGDRTRDNRALTKKDYEELGRVVGSLTQRANQEYEYLVKEDSAYQDTVRRVMLRMVSLQGGELARRQVPKSELVYSDQEENKRVQTVIKRFSEARLIVEGSNAQGESYVEPAHDALVQGWDQLLAWKKENEENIILQRRLTPDAEEWKSIKAKFQPLGLQTKAKTAIDWFDHRLYTIENSLTKISAQFARLWKRSQNQQKHYGEKPVQFLWDANPYLDVVAKEISSDDNWLNQVEADFVEESVLQKRRNMSWRWRIAITVILGLSGLTLWALIRQRDAEIGQISTSRQTSEALFLSNQELDALISSAQAGKNFSYPLLQIFPPDSQLREQVVQTLRKVFYGMRERNRWQPMQGMEVRSIFFHPNGKLLIATKSNNGTVQIWDMKTKEQPVLELAGHKFQGGDSSDNVFFSPDGSKIATVDSQGIIRLWDWNGNKLGNEFYAGYRIEKLSFSPNGQSFMTKGYENKDDYNNIRATFRWWNLQGSSRKQSTDIVDFDFKSDGIPIRAYQSNDRIILSGLSSQPIALPNTLQPSTQQVRVSVSPDGNYIVLAEIYGSASLQMWKWNGSNLEKVVVSDIDTDHLNKAQIASFSSDGKLVAFADNNTVRIYNLSSLVDTALINFNEMRLPSGTIQSMTFSQDSKYLATLSEDGTVRLWDVDIPQPEESNQYQFLQSDIQNVSFSHDRKTVATVGNDGITIRLFDSNGKPLSVFSVTSGKVTSISFSPNSNIIAIGSDNGNVSLFSQNGQGLQLINDAHSKNVVSVVFSPDGQRLATLGSDGKDSASYVAKLWRLNGDKLEFEKSSLEIPFDFTIHGIKFQQNDEPKVITEDTFSGATPPTVSWWNMSGERQDILSGQIKREQSDIIALNYDGSLLASVSRSKNIVKLWDLQGKKLLTEFPGTECNTQADKCIISMSFSPDGSTLAVIGSNGSAKFLELGSFDNLLAKGCDRMRDYLTGLDEKNSDRHLCDDVPPITTKLDK